MFRKCISLTLILVLILSCQMAFATSNHPVTADQIIIVEPSTEIISNEKQVYVTVNIVSNKLKDRPLTMSIVRVENKLTFAENLGSDLKVSVMNLVSSAIGNMDRQIKYNATYDTSAPVYSENYKKETQLINRYYELGQSISNKDEEIKVLNKKYNFASIVGKTEELAKLSTEAHTAYKRWTNLKMAIAEERKELEKIQFEFSTYFEKQVYVDQINGPSYSKVVGKLSTGHYVLRFIDDEKQLIKEFEFDVIDNQEIIKVMPLIGNSK